MNKLLMVLLALAVCLVSANAFVKRDAPAAPAAEQNPLKDIQKTLEDFGKAISDNVQQVLNPDAIKEKIAEANQKLKEVTFEFTMNKLLIVFVAVCLVSAQAFVKRDAPADNKNYLETLQKQIQEFGQSFNTQVSNAFDPDTIKKNFNQFVDGVTKTMNDMKAATEPKKA
ncbi:hypothetical protein B5X24_HaOG211672 [Helicoverpa armigera]|uniref:Uncharacterized protein n=2 Tax=Helicoverpa armigera TaxID=29058 RepID=A0A2W1BEL9_HELAM|nr:hypothetical protein B5X24_HaOG211672 [Helicoverpa armigera]